MKILCAYHNRSVESSETDPQKELVGHVVTIVHSYDEVGLLMCDTSRGIPTFDIVLMDVVLPWAQNSTEMIPTVLLMRHIDTGLVRGMGIFVPPYFESEFAYDHDQYHMIVADRSCWTFSGKRNWSKLLGLVVTHIDQLGT